MVLNKGHLLAVVKGARETAHQAQCSAVTAYTTQSCLSLESSLHAI